MATAVTSQMDTEMCFSTISNENEHKIMEQLDNLKESTTLETTTMLQEDEEYNGTDIKNVESVISEIKESSDVSLSSHKNNNNGLPQNPLVKDQESVSDTIQFSHTNTINSSQAAGTAVNDNGLASNEKNNILHRKKYSTILDSDSEEENIIILSKARKSLVINEEDTDSKDSDFLSNQKTDMTVRSKHNRKLLDSDSEDDEQLQGNDNDTMNKDNDAQVSSRHLDMLKSHSKIGSKVSKLVDSDSEDEADTENFFDNIKKHNNNKKPSESSKASDDLDSSKSSTEHFPRNKEKSHDSEYNTSHKDAKQKISAKLKALIDSESEGEEYRVDHLSSEEGPISKSGKKSKPKLEKKQKGSIRASKEEAMRQIHSETQRLLRESAISLPYHRPKQRTLQEFLNRKKVAPTLPQAPTTAAKLKMSSEIVSKVLEEKEREAELFYKSSDSEDEPTDIREKLNENKISEKNINMVHASQASAVENIAIEETQKMKNNMQNAHNKKEILQQGSTDIGIPRQLFGKDFDGTENDNLESIIDNENSSSKTTHDKKQQCKEHKFGLREVSVPRKLFEEAVPMDTEGASEENEQQSTGKDIEGSKTNEEGYKNKHVESTEIHTLKEIGTSSQISLSENNCVKINEVSSTTTKMDITETPHISNIEIAKVLQKHKECESLDISDKIEVQNTLKQAQEVEKSSEKIQDSEEENCSNEVGKQVLGLPLPDIEEKSCKNVEMKKKLLSHIQNVKPTLKGSPGMVINLTGDIKPNTEGINSLIDRFYKHTTVVQPTENTSNVSVIHLENTVNGVIPVKEILPYQITSTKSDDPELSKPGAKLLRLKEDLKLKMTMKRKEEWKEKEKQQKMEEEEDDESSCIKTIEEDECDEFSESGESEPEENDIIIKEKKRRNHQFADEEAEVSEDEGNEDENKLRLDSDEEVCEDNDMDDEDVNSSCREDDNDENDSEEETKGDAANVERRKRKLRRIVKPFDEDSNATSTKDLENEMETKRKGAFDPSKTNVDMFESDNGNDAWTTNSENEFAQDFMQSKAGDQSCQTPCTKINSILNFVSPITQLTALKGPDSNKKSVNSKDILIEACGPVFDENTLQEKSSQDTYNFDKRAGLQKKLFDDFGEPPNDEEIMQLCSGKFPATQASRSDTIPPIGSAVDTNISESQLLQLCSGTFSTQKDAVEKSQDAPAAPQNDEESQNMQLFLSENSPSAMKTMEEKQETITTNVPWTNFRIASSSDEEEVTNDGQRDTKKKKKLKKRKVKKLELSDEEDQESDSEVEEDDEQYLDYDSEENEIIVSKKNIKETAAGFLEAEAELSESEWGSADEDEKDLDKLEMEEGDNEDIDEEQMKDQLGKIHMKQLLDEDKRDVRMLKELLFEEGDLYTEGGGRERKFKWRNIDKLGEDADAPRPADENDGWLDPLENEDDIEQIKQRHEREKFLQERKKESDDDLEDMLGDSQFFKLGMKALKKIQKNKAKAETDSPAVTQSEDQLFAQSVSDILNNKNSGKKAQALYRHSVLARGEETLVRIAKVVKETDVTSVLKRPGKFCVFTSISPVKDDAKENKEEQEMEATVSSQKSLKRKAPKGDTPKTAKKSKFSTSNAIVKTLFD